MLFTRYLFYTCLDLFYVRAFYFIVWRHSPFIVHTLPYSLRDPYFLSLNAQLVLIIGLKLYCRYDTCVNNSLPKSAKIYQIILNRAENPNCSLYFISTEFDRKKTEKKSRILNDRQF